MNVQADPTSTSTLTVPDPQADRPLWAAALRATLTEDAVDSRILWIAPSAIVTILNRLAATDIGRVVAETGDTWALRGARLTDLDEDGNGGRLWLRGSGDGDEHALDHAVLSYLPHPRILSESVFVLNGQLASADAGTHAVPVGVLIGYHSAALLTRRRVEWRTLQNGVADPDAVADDLASEMTYVVSEGPLDPVPDDDPLEAAAAAFARHRGDRPPGPLDQADVDVIATALLAQGEQPTMEAVRRVAGGGSNTTIHPKLKDFYRKEGPRRFGDTTVIDPTTTQVKTLLDHFIDAAQTAARATLRPQQEELVIGQRALGARLEALTAERTALAEERVILAREEIQRQRLVDHLTEQLSAAQTSEGELNTAMMDVRQTAALLEADRERFRADADEAQRSLAQLTQTHDQLRERLAHTEASLAAARERIDTLQTEAAAQAERLRQERDAASAAAQTREADLADARSQRDQRAGDVVELRERLEQALNTLAGMRSENARLDGLEVAAQTQRDRAAQLAGELRAVTAECQRLRAAAAPPPTDS